MERSPAYIKIYEILKRQIIDGEYQVGELLPPEPELEKRFHVSRTTIRRAVEMLSQEGYLKAKQGRGTQVLDFKHKRRRNLVTSISETLRQKGFDVRPSSMQIDLIQAGEQIAQDLEISPGERIVRIQRIQFANNQPIAIMHNHLLPDLVPGIEGYLNKFTSLYRFLETRYNIAIDSSWDRISAKNADLMEARMLQVPVGTALLFMKCVCYQEGRPVCADRLSIVGDRYELDITMNGRYREHDMFR